MNYVQRLKARIYILEKTTKKAVSSDGTNLEYPPTFGANLANPQKIKSANNSFKILKILNVAVY